jgi:hypothetical protein
MDYSLIPGRSNGAAPKWPADHKVREDRSAYSPALAVNGG